MRPEQKKQKYIPLVAGTKSANKQKLLGVTTFSKKKRKCIFIERAPLKEKKITDGILFDGKKIVNIIIF